MQLTPISILIIILAVLAALAIAGHLFLRPRMLRWGATGEEVSRTLAGDELIPDPVLATTRAVRIRAQSERVWPWLAQMGQGRGGFYSYDWLENLAGMDIHNVHRIVPELQDLQPGDLIPFWRGAGVNVVTVEPPRLLVLGGTLNPSAGEAQPAGGTWVFALKEQDSAGTRLVVRSRVARFQPAWLCLLMMRLMEPMHFVMERKMMLRIKELAETVQEN